MKNNIKAIRKIRNVSQQVIADALGVTITAVNKWENNFKIKIPEKRVKEIAQLLGVNEVDILAEDLNTDKIKLTTAREALAKLERSGLIEVSYVDKDLLSDKQLKAINERFTWKQSMHPKIESFVEENFSKAFSYKEQVAIGKNINLYLEEDSYKLEFLQRVVQFLTDSDSNRNESNPFFADLADLYEKHR
ncbi:helix-turn-helix transcriptional regulator [Paenibacillus sedimenti]|uniref:Helix-turn-helix transcriptional regulator n=1 Tax=Paenibacillus sedimenti TaxID=2770274 RepID=A0A926KP52_9BACL|nr:helix-turn-helix transcriptional regulator [Paenibacillus sedimenti]MBD0379580.1 helix-turn-helix transcriptional regulator [Paenibacillus sedimenti]